MNKKAAELINSDPCFLRISQDILRNHFLHAQLICGKDLSYAREFSILAMKKILEHNGLTELCHKLDNGTYLDLLELSNLKSIKVEDLKPLLEKSSNRAIESDFKFFLIVGAHNMTPEAQNKLLKTLEEPNPNHFFFLCVPSRFLVLQTIVSRCNVVELEPLEKQVVKKYLVDNFNAKEEKALEATELSLGNITRAEEYLLLPASNFNIALSVLTQIQSSADCVKHVITLQKSDIEEVLDYSGYIILDALKLKNNVSDIWFSSYADKINGLASCNQKGLLFIYDTILKLKELLRANVSNVAIVDKFVLAIAEGKHK